MLNKLFSIQRTIWLAGLLLAGLACSLTDGSSSANPTSLPPINNPTLTPSCRPVNKPEDEAAILYDAQVAEHAQPKIEITILTAKLLQRVAFIRPDRFLMHNEAGGTWDEAASIGGTAYARSSDTPAWVQVPLLDVTAAIMMQTFIDPPKKASADLSKLGVTKVNARSIGYDATAFFGSCVYDLTFLSGATIVYSQKTWIDPKTGARFKFEARDEHGTVIETRLFEYEDVKIEAP